MAIYLDEAATTKPKKEVIEAMLPYFTEMWENPSSLYKPAVDVKKKIEEARNTVAKFIGANGNEIFFTSGGSESNCWAIQGFVKQCEIEGIYPIVITSVIEHKSILDCVDDVDALFISVDDKGFVDINELKELLEKISAYNKYNHIEDKILVSIQFANNEIGTVQSIKEISDLVHEYGGVFHTDATQAFGQLLINVNYLGIDMLSASGHKIGTPKGVGILYKKKSVDIRPIIYGSQMDGMRGGTENVPYIIGMAKAVELCEIDLHKTMIMIEIRDNLIDLLKSKFDCTLNGDDISRLPNNINVTFPQNITGEALLYVLDSSDIYISTGSACNSHNIEPSYVLKSIGLSDEEAMKTIRITLPDIDNYTVDEYEELLDEFIKEIDKAIRIIEIKWE